MGTTLYLGPQAYLLFKILNAKLSLVVIRLITIENRKWRREGLPVPFCCLSQDLFLTLRPRGNNTVEA